MNRRVRINEQIRSPEVRVIGPEGENLGVLKTSEAIEKAKGFDLDLIEISPTARPPVAKIQDYGKYQYNESKKQKEAKAKSKQVEVKNVQVKLGTDSNDLALKAKRISEWLKKGNRVKVELFLPGRSKYMDRDFLKERLNRVLNLVSEDYRTALPIKKNPKGIYCIIEKDSSK